MKNWMDKYGWTTGIVHLTAKMDSGNIVSIPLVALITKKWMN